MPKFESLSFDHRLIDGALADQFTAEVKQGLDMRLFIPISLRREVLSLDLHG
jgi:hypothetical protein